MPHQLLTSDTARRIAAHVSGVEPTAPARFLGEGTLNVVWAVTIREGTFAVRLPKDLSDTDAPVREARFLRQAALCGVGVPAVRAVGVWQGQPYLIESLAPGTSGDLPGADTTLCWRHLGECARRIHDIAEPDSPARARMSREEIAAYDRDAPETWRQFVRYGRESLTPQDALLSLGVYRAEQRDTVAAIFEGLQAQSFRFGLNHNDLDPRHCFTAPNGIVTLIDWGCAEINLVPHYDLAEILRWHRPDSASVTAFHRGYGLTDTDFAALLPQVRDFQLLKAFDLVRWAIDRRPEEIPVYADRARTTLLQRSAPE